MKISTNTVNVLKNFAKINPSIVVQEGNVLKTISPSKTIMARANVEMSSVVQTEEGQLLISVNR